MADTETVELGTFEELEVVGTTIAIRNTGDGLSKAMEVAPEIMHQGQVVYVVTECKVIDVQHPFSDDTETRVHRKHILKAGNARTVPAAMVKATLNEMADRIQKARDEKSKAMALDLDYDPLGVAEKVDDAAENSTDRTGDAPEMKTADAKKATATKPPAKKAPAKRAPRKAPAKKSAKS